MDVVFNTQALLDAYQDESVGRQLWGPDAARKYVQRLDVLYAKQSGRDLYAEPALRLHPLKGDRKGQHSIRLTREWRLIVTFDDEAMRVVCVEEVTHHYGD